MSVDEIIGAFKHPRWLIIEPLGPVVRPYLESLQAQRYDEMTTRHYLSAVAHFNFWAASELLAAPNIDEASITRFLGRHLPTCACPCPRFRGRREIRAAMRQVLRLLQQKGLVEPKEAAATPISAELQEFRHYLADSRGLAASTCLYELKVVQRFLQEHFGSDPIELSSLSPQRVDDWIIGLAQHYRPGRLEQIRTSLRSYFRFRATRGDVTQALCAALPMFAHREVRLIKTLSEAQLERFLKSFDLSYPTGLRDYAMAHCLSDLGLRGLEVTQLTLDDIDWRAGTVTVRKTKGQRVRILPLPVATGHAIVRYLRTGRPNCSIRRLFVRHVAPIEKPLEWHALPNAMNRAFARCGLTGQFSGTHVLRRTLATRLQRCDTSLKAIADVLGHRELQTTTRYAKVDFERLRRLALPWAGRQP